MKNCLVLGFLLALALPAPGRELVLNGAFEDGLAHWTAEVNNDEGSYDIDVCTTYRAGPGSAVRVRKHLRYYARLSQVVELPGPDVRFSGSLRLLVAKEPVSGYFVRAALNVEYLDADSGTLGRTMFVRYLGDHPPQNTPRQHVHLVTGADWEDYRFLVADELRDNLPGIDAADVAGIRLVLESYGTGRPG